jgi:uncharacterized membrane protein
VRVLIKLLEDDADATVYVLQEPYLALFALVVLAACLVFLSMAVAAAREGRRRSAKREEKRVRRALKRYSERRAQDAAPPAP